MGSPHPMGLVGASGNVSAGARRRLVVFDFDQTIVDADSYTTVQSMAGERGLTLPEHLQVFPNHEGWQEFMQGVLQFHHANRISSAEIRARLESLPLVEGMPQLLEYLREKRSSHIDTIILSDANMCFVQWILQRHGLVDLFANIITNPAVLDENNGLVISSYHQQTDCQLSPRNMCKGRILQEWMAEQELRTRQLYKSVYYVGDGANDLCPGLRLTSQDTFFVRRDFPLAKKLINNHVQCAIELWSNGNEVLERIKDLSKV